MGFPPSSVGTESACNAGGPGSIPGLGRSSGEGIGYPIQYSTHSSILGLPCGSAGKESPCKVGDLVQSLGWEDPLEKGKTTESLECEIKWALGSITMNKTSGGNRIPVELFQILKDDAVKVLHSICQQIWKTQQWLQDRKRSVFIPIPKKGNAKECSSYHTAVLISYISKVITKILQAGLQQCEPKTSRCTIWV